jgi:hypothetical protein
VRKPVTEPAKSEVMYEFEPEGRVDEMFEALRKTDRCCRLMLKELRESHPDILEGPGFEELEKLARRQLRENRELLGTGPATEKAK